MKEDLDHPTKIQNLEKQRHRETIISTFPSRQALLPPPEKYIPSSSKQDLEEEVAELFYDMIKDFPELTFGMIEIKNAIGRFHVILDSVLVFKKVGLYPI